MIAFICNGILGLCILLTAIRIFKGPKLADRAVAVDLSGVLMLGFVLSHVLRTKDLVYLDVAVVFALIAFLGTVIFARFLETIPSNPKKKEIRK